MKHKSIIFAISVLIISSNSNNCFCQYNYLKYKKITNEIFYPEIITKNSPCNYFISFEKAYFGKLEISLSYEGTDTVVVHIGEKSLENHVDLNPPGTVRYLSDTIILKEGNHNYLIDIPDFEPPGWAKGSGNEIPMPDYVGNIIPFRHVEIIGYKGTLDKKNIHQIAYFYPFNDDASYCKTSSEELNQVYELCKHSMKATSFAGVYVDGDRERRPYEGDAYINQLSHYSVDAEYALLRKTADHLFKKPTWPTEWPFHMHMILWEDYMYTGKTDYLKLYYDSLNAIVKRTALNESGLTINNLEHDIVDWPRNERDGYELKEINNVPNAFYNNCLQLLSRIAGILNNKSDSVELAYRAQKHKEAFIKHFWNTETGLFIDAIGSDHSALHSNIFPIVFGLASDKQIEKIKPFIKSKGMAVSVYGAQYLLDALYIIGEEKYALSLMTSKNKRSWMHMIEQGSTITLEAWNADAKKNLDWNHAWGAAPGNIIARRTFGIRPMEPGFKKALIQPLISDLKEGKYIHPTINGEIELSFINEDSLVTFNTKHKMSATLILPSSKYNPENIFVNGIQIKPVTKGKELLITINAGSNSIKCGKNYFF